MLLNYPPPTAVNFRQTFLSPGHKERQTLYGIRQYLENEEMVHDEDLLLIVDGQDTWFQLPSDVIVSQYEAVVENANARLLKKYGLDEEKRQKFFQTIVFGAGKACEGDDMACKYAPRSILPNDLYSSHEEGRTEDMPATFLNSKAVMGPAKDLRTFFDAALTKYEKMNSEKQTVQSVLATMFGEQQLRRDAALTRNKSAISKLREWVGNTAEEQVAAEHRLEDANVTIHPNTKYEYSIGLDYTYTLFQPLSYATLDELVPLVHGNSTDLAKYRHPKSLTPQLSLPPALFASKPPFWSPNLYLHNPSPDTNKPAYIDKLELTNTLDTLPDRHTPWSTIPLIQNTYTGAIPALILQAPKSAHTSKPSGISRAQISFNDLWFAPHKRALLRQYFRTPQSPNGYHNSLVGGDRFWDQRGGRGGIWTSKEQIWLPWGEVDGVCGTLVQLEQVFDDGKGVWMHELEPDNEAQRVKDEVAFHERLEEARKKEEEKEIAKAKVAAHIAKLEQAQKQKEKQHKERLEAAERKKKAKEDKEKANVQRLEEIERKKKVEAEQAKAKTNTNDQSKEQPQDESSPATTWRVKRWNA